MKERELEEGPYTIIKAGDRQVGGIMKMPAQVPAGIPPHWESYVTVDPGVGRFCTFQDPQGAVLCAITYEKRTG